MTYTAEEIFSSWIFWLFIALFSFFIIHPLILLYKELMNVKESTGGKKRSKHLY